MLRSKTPTKACCLCAITSTPTFALQLYALIDDISPVLLKTLAEPSQSNAVCLMSLSIHATTSTVQVIQLALEVVAEICSSAPAAEAAQREHADAIFAKFMLDLIGSFS